MQTAGRSQESLPAQKSLKIRLVEGYSTRGHGVGLHNADTVKYSKKVAQRGISCSVFGGGALKR